jgi:membrane protease subunit (stomatin/prohibitin family)
MSLFQSNNPKEKQHSGILGSFSVDVIKWEPENDNEASLIVHKFAYEDFPNGSYLIVNPSQMAIFTNNLTAGSSMDSDGAGQSQISVFKGPCKIKLETGDSRFAPFRNISHSLTGGESAFHSTVYFVNTTYMNELSWGTQAPIVVMDPEEEINVHVRAFGLFGVHIEQVNSITSAVQARKFLQKVVGTRSDYTRNELVQFMRARILEYVPDLLAKSIVDHGIGILKISTHLSEFSSSIFLKLIEHFDDFGLTLDNFSFHSINAPDEDLRAINEMKIKRKSDQLEAEGTAKKMDIESAARARMREREGYTYQQEQSYSVMEAAAANEGTSSTFLGAGLGLGMGVGVGSAFGAGMGNIAQTTIGNVDMSQPKETEATICPTCGHSNPAGAKFCLKCGSKIKEEPRCPECNEIIIKGSKFCVSCGKRLSATCPNCGKELDQGAKFCVECGTKI